MKRDIIIPEVKDVAVAIVRDIGENNAPVWNTYLLNLGTQELTNVLVSSTGYGLIGNEQRQTSTLRHYLGTVLPSTFLRIEPIVPELFGLTNEYWVSFYIGKEIFDKKYVFLAESVREDLFTRVPLLEKAGVMIK